jgi:dsRNA-specific ribonuclease
MDPQLEQAQAATQQFMQQYGLDARTMASVGQMAQQAIQDQSLYAMLREQLLGAQILTEKELPEQVNYITMAALAGMGKMAGEM